MSRFSRRLRQLRTEQKLSQAELALHLHTSKSSVNMYERGEREPGLAMLGAIASFFDVSMDDLLGQSQPGARRPAAPDGAFPTAGTVPLVGRIACGTPIWAEQNIEEYIPLPAHCRADFALQCQGDSMTGARIFDGDTVYIRRQPDVDNGEIAAVLIGRDATLKKVYRTPDTLVLRPENPKYSDKIFIGEEMNKVTILGKAVAFTSPVQHEVDRADGEWRRYVGQPVAARGGGVRPMTEAQAKMAWKYEQSQKKAGK